MSFKTGAQKFLSDAKAYTDKVAKKLTDSLNEHKEDTNNPHSVTAEQAGTYAKEHLDETFSTKEEVTQTANELKKEIEKNSGVDSKKLHAISTQAFFVIADEQRKAKKIMFWSNVEQPFKVTANYCKLHQATYNLSNGLYGLGQFDLAEYEKSATSASGRIYIFDIKKDILAENIDYCMIETSYQEGDYSDQFGGIPKIIKG
ncbi:hypothetical protein P0E66_13925 [Enterococcus faecalis]|uniref:hypothetical protein n=1 Tax=Enterococcus faecalis TaxID=1351 RepID=UPI001A0F2304|nr:hypothetical protein [Enterococcus faecalis]EGO8428657.1 hypothetical protein [Enterococcus faecalis]MDN3202224.1 hypothetical protein [Enterococcus faecalis]